MEWFKPIIKWNAKGIMRSLLVVGILMMVLGFYTRFFQASDYIKTTAVITRIEQEEDFSADDGYREIAYVTYTVNGREYTEKLDEFSDAFKVGKEIKVKYDPSDPSKVLSDMPGFSVYMIGVGGLLVAWGVYTEVRNGMLKKKIDEIHETNPSVLRNTATATETKYYFLTDFGTAKGTCHIENEKREIVYEALCTEFSLLADSEYEFVDHVHGTSETHIVGKTADTESNAFYALDKYSTFTFDGENIWKYLHKNGIKIRTGLDGIYYTYDISMNGQQIAHAKVTNKNPHEEDEGGILTKIPFPGFFRITTNQENLNVVFLVMFAIGRTNMIIYS